MKELYNFKVDKEVEKEIKTETPEGVLITKEKVLEPINIILKAPSRLEREQASEFEAAEWSKAISAGILSKQMLAKIYSDNGGVLSKEDIKYSTQLIEDYNEKVLLWQKAVIDGEDKEGEKLKEVKDEIADIYTKIQALDAEREELFKNSAETRAKDKTIQWLILNLTYAQEGNSKPRPFFGDGDFAEKVNKLYELSELSDQFNKTVIEKSALYITFWYLGRLSTKEDFQFLDTELSKTETVEPV